MSKRAVIRPNSTNGGASVFFQTSGRKVNPKSGKMEIYLDWEDMFWINRAFATVEENKRTSLSPLFKGRKKIAQLAVLATGLRFGWDAAKERLGIK